MKMRPASQVMRLERIGSFHQSRLSFMRVLLRHLKTQNWQFKRSIWQINEQGVGVATYQAIGAERTYTLIAFAHDLPDEKRSDRVIAEAWDATFTLFDGIPKQEDIDRLSQNVPLQEAGRISQSELCLSRANRSVRLFQYVIDCLSQGTQPHTDEISKVGYLMRTTAVYGASKFGAADRSVWLDREEFQGSFQPELLTVWLIRTFTIDLVEHLAQCRSPHAAVKLDIPIKRLFGIGNSTGLGMAPFLITHPSLIHSWVHARESALAEVRSIQNTQQKHINAFLHFLNSVIKNSEQWKVSDELQTKKIRQFTTDLYHFKEYASNALKDHNDYPWNTLYLWAEANLELEAQEQIVSLLLEPYGEIIDELAHTMSIKEEEYFHIDGKMDLAQLQQIIEQNYSWAIKIDFNQKDSIARLWYVSQEKLEPRLGERFTDSLEEYEQPLAPARDISYAYSDMQHYPKTMQVAHFLFTHPEHRHVVRRLQLTAQLPYAEIQDNTISADMLPLNLLRCKLSFFGATKFDPRSDRWLRITMFQGCPYPDELQHSNPDNAFYL